MNIKDVILKQINYTVKEAIDHLENALKQKGITIYARIDQQAEALKGGISLLPLEFLMFGNPAKGALVMGFDPVCALDLPLKIIAWTDKEQRTCVAYNDPDMIQRRYGLNDQLTALLDIGPIVAAALT